MEAPPGRCIELPGRGTTYACEVGGPPDAPTLMLLHGWTATAALNWLPALPELGRRFRVIALDQRGHGRGIRCRQFRLEDCADDVIAAADVLGADRVIPVGYSMGGPVAQLTWQRHPDRVAGLVLCATSRNFRGSRRDQLAFMGLAGLGAAVQLVPSLIVRQLVHAAAALPLPDARDFALGEVRGHDPLAVLGAARAIGRFSSRDWIADVDVPTAVVVTTHDRVVPQSRQRKLANSILNATIHEVAADHFACLTDPDRFVPVLSDACESVALRAGLARAA